MLRDVFYYGVKPNVHPREQFANNLSDARKKCTTEHFWIVNEYCDYTNFDWDFDFDFLPDEDVWAQDHNNVWPSQHQKDSGTWLCSKIESDTIIYRTDVSPVKRKNEKNSFWKVYTPIDEKKFDFSWHPDPTDPLFIYVWGNKYIDGVFEPTVEYCTPGATEKKYMFQHAPVLPQWERWKLHDNIDKESFDFTWRPDPREPAYIYVFGNQWYDAIKMPTATYTCEGATEYKYITDKIAKLKPNKENWSVPKNIDVSGFDFSWLPDPHSPPYIYYFPTQWALSGGPIYTMPGATEKKFLEGPVAKALTNMDHWEIPDNIDRDSFDFSWHPYIEDIPFVYHFATQHQKAGGPIYRTPGSDSLSPVKYIDRRIIKAKAIPCKNKFTNLNDHVIDFDYSWHPDDTEDPYIYIFGNQYYSAEKMPTVEYRVDGAVEVKYINTIKATLGPNKENWRTIIPIDETMWDYAWIPDPGDPPYIYVWGNQWNNAETESTIEYHVPGATEKKYMSDRVATVLPDMTNWKFNYKIDESKFDFSWRPDPGSPPYIYSFGSNLYPAEEMSTVEYHVPGATEYKYIPEIIAQLAQDKSKWIIPDNVDITDFDFSWHPNPKDPKFIYYAGTQWQKTGGPKYAVEGATDIKYLEGKKVKALPNKTNWILPTNVDVTDFDFSWHPDETEPPYIYQFGTQWALSGGPKYVMHNATEIKYMENPVAKAIPDKTNWIIPDNIDASSFDFSWHPYVEDKPYIYQFGTQWQKTGGPKYVTPGADEFSSVKYIDRRIIKSKRLPDKTNWELPNNIDPNSVDYSWHPDDTEDPFIYEFGTQWHDRGGPKYIVPNATVMKYSKDIKGKLIKERTNWEILIPIIEETFDFSWHPHPDDPPYIYVFGNNLYPAEEMETVRYVVEGATQFKYINDIKATLASDKSNWEIPIDVDVSNFDFSWKPHPKAPPYIYEFGTQWQKTGGPRYIVQGATEVNYISGSKAIYKPKTRSKNWQVSENLDISEFDFSWHPDSTDKPYIYVFGTQWALSGGPRYVVPKAKEIKYIDNPVAKMRSNKKNWDIPKDIDQESFDFSWHPYEEDKPYIYQFGTQHQKTGGPRYITPGSDDTSAVKYIDRRILKAKKLPNKLKFEVIGNHVIKEFDYSWHPDDTEEPYIYVFGNEQYNSEIMPTIRYIMQGATKIKYINEIKAKLDSNTKNWREILPIDKSTFDYSWLPDPTSPPYIYVFGNQWNRAEIEPTIEYVVPGATDKKYVHDIVAKVLPDKSKFKLLRNIVEDQFDYTWRPDPNDPPYIYVFGNQHYSAEKMPTVEYIVGDATDKKYVNDIHAKLTPNYNNWREVSPIDKTKFDFSWIPDPHDPPYIYTWGSKYIEAELEPTLEYHAPGAKERKYMQEKVDVLPLWDRWVEVIPIDKVKSADNGFDFSWRPDPREPAFIYVFGNQWNRAEIEPTLEYHVPGATDRKYVSTIAYVLPNREKFEILDSIDDFDFSWRPNPNDPPYTYIFGNQWNKAEKEPTIKYNNKGSDIKYINDIVATVSSNMKPWHIPEGFIVENFDFSWRPDPYDPAYVYEFATEYSDRGGPKYVVNGATETKYMSFIRAKLKANIIPKYYIETTLDELVSWHPTETFWALQKSIKYDNFDFNWRPNKDIEKYVNTFGSPESETTQTYFINAIHYVKGDKEKNYIQQETKADSEYLSELFVQPDIFFVDRGNPESQQRFEQIKLRFTNVNKTRFLNSWVDTINRCINRSNTELCWILNSELDYTDFDFKYYPNPWQMKMVHVFGTQWSHWGTTFMVNRETFSEDTKYIKIIEHLSNLNFVKDRRAKATNNLYDIYVINHGNKELNQVVDAIKRVANDKSVNVVDYDKTYLQTIKNIVDNINPRKEHYIWICSSICNYSNFDFTYICDPFARENLHVFPSDTQKFGDTFFINVNHTKQVISELEVLQQYNKVNFNSTIKTRRIPAPVIKVNTDTHVDSIDTNFDFPYAIFTTEEFKVHDIETLNLWQDDTKQLLITSTGATRIIVPKEAKNYIKNELYDYPYIKTASKLLSSKPLDIVFLSNGEKNAEENYKHLLVVTEGLKNRIVRVDGVNGRVDAYHAAVKASETPWAFTVFAKLKVNGKFDWGWQPDRLQVPKHYIFHAKNPVNGLEYGHQGMIAYNKQLVLNNFGSGLDFTLDDPHETVELVSGTANFNTDAYSTWRTAFREVIKLKSDYTEISQERLNIWLTKAKGKFAKECLQGANDAVEYYQEVSGDMDQLKLSYEWSWLKDYYNRKYK